MFEYVLSLLPPHMTVLIESETINADVRTISESEQTSAASYFRLSAARIAIIDSILSCDVTIHDFSVQKRRLGV